MYQYSNDAYNSIDGLPQQGRFRSGRGPTSGETVGIGYYGASRTAASSRPKVGKTNDMSSGGGVARGTLSPLSPVSPPIRRPLDGSGEQTSYLWNYIHDGVDLSPPNARPDAGRSLKSPTRPLSEGCVLEAFNRSGLSEGRRPGSSSVPALGYNNEYSPQSTEQSSHSFVEYPLLRKQRSGADPDGAPLSLRARWEQSHRRPVQDVRGTSRTQLSSSDAGDRSFRSSNEPGASGRPDAAGTRQSPQSTLERDYNTYSTSSSLRRDPLSHRKLPNGSVRAALDASPTASRRSLDVSRLSLRRSRAGKAVLYGKGYGVHNSLVNMGLASLLSLVMCYLSTQLLFRVATRQSSSLFGDDSVLSSNASHANVSEVVVALASIAIMLDLCCLLTCVLQGYFAAKLMKCKQGQERAFHYLKECMPTRFIAILGFFFSVPAFFFGLMLYIIMEYRSTAAIIAVVVLTIGVSFCISMASHSTYMWFTEKAQANKNLPVGVYEKNNNRTKIVNGELTNPSELSTLV